jgi:hypothetical protein
VFANRGGIGSLSESERQLLIEIAAGHIKTVHASLQSTASHSSKRFGRYELHQRHLSVDRVPHLSNERQQSRSPGAIAALSMVSLRKVATSCPSEPSRCFAWVQRGDVAGMREHCQPLILIGDFKGIRGYIRAIQATCKVWRGQSGGLAAQSSHRILTIGPI